MKTLEQKLKQLGREIGKLPETAGRKIARRNGRKRVLGLLRQIRAEVDEQWPAIVERAGQRRLTWEGRNARAKRNGLTLVSENQAGRLALAGVTLKRINGLLWSPRWAHTLLEKQPTRLAAAVKDKKLRNSILAELALLS